MNDTRGAEARKSDYGIACRACVFIFAFFRSDVCCVSDNQIVSGISLSERSFL